jgi:hypothetical protein
LPPCTPMGMRHQAFHMRRNEQPFQLMVSGPFASFRIGHLKRFKS